MPIGAQDIVPLSGNLAKKVAALKIKKYRDIHRAFLAEGVRLCEEALKTNTKILDVIVTRESLEQNRISALVQKAHETGLSIHLATSNQLVNISDEKTPQGVAFVIQKPDATFVKTAFSRLLVACENIQDPGNLGAIFRTAVWFGIKSIILSEGCVDPYNSKVVRGSMGAIFRLDIFAKENLTKTIQKLRKNGYRAIGTVVGAENPIHNVISTDKDILIVGNEANGLSRELLECVDVPLSIPGQGEIESLNVAIATAICLYHFSHH